MGNSSGTRWDEMGRMDEQRSEQGEQRRPRPEPLTTHLLEPQNRRDEWTKRGQASDQGILCYERPHHPEPPSALYLPRDE